jgi:hypothetical protein
MLMYKLEKKTEKLFISKFVGTGPSSYEKKRMYRAAVSRRLRNADVERFTRINNYGIIIEY